jgi:hypothetical protein
MVPRGDGNHSAKLDLLPSGRYQVEAVALLDGEVHARTSLQISVEPRGLEDLKVGGDRGLLRELAAATGGAFYEAEEADSIPVGINPGQVVERTYLDLEPRLNPPWFIAVAVLLGLEWLIRKRRLLL